MYDIIELNITDISIVLPSNAFYYSCIFFIFSHSAYTNIKHVFMGI